MSNNLIIGISKFNVIPFNDPREDFYEEDIGETIIVYYHLSLSLCGVYHISARICTSLTHCNSPLALHYMTTYLGRVDSMCDSLSMRCI